MRDDSPLHSRLPIRPKEISVKRTFVSVVVLSVVGLAGCGGGGSAGVSAPASAAPTVTITAANQAAVTRSMFNGGQAFGQSQPFAVAGGAAAQSIGSASVALRTGLLQSVVRRSLVAALAPRHSARIASATRAAATTSSTDPCSLSGSITTTVNDADNSQSLSSGDVLTLTFSQCQDSLDDVVSGGMVFTIGSVTSEKDDSVQFSGTLAFGQLIESSGSSVTDIEGTVGVVAAITSNSFQIAVTVGASALKVTSTAPGYLDTIVYDPGMQLTVTATDGTVPESDVRLDGSFTASSIGGRIKVATLLPLRQLGGEADPRSGQVVVTGAAGTQLRVSVLNATSVQLDLDADGDGAYERSGVFAWTTIG
jgi:hypothetical protein